MMMTNSKHVLSTLRDYIVALSPGVVFGDSDNLVDAGAIQSIRLLELVDFVEDAFGVSVSSGDLYEGHFDSAESIAQYVCR